MIRELTRITHRAQGVKFFMPALLCQAAPSQIVSGLNRRPHRGQTPVACSHKLACFMSDSSSYLFPAELNPSSWHLNASWSLFPFPYPPQLEGVGETEVNESEWVEFCPLSAIKGASKRQLLPVELLGGNQKTRLLLCGAGVMGASLSLSYNLVSIVCVCVWYYHLGVHDHFINAIKMQHNTEKEKAKCRSLVSHMTQTTVAWVWHIQQHNLISAWILSLFMFIIVSLGHHSKKLGFGLWSLKLKSGNAVLEILQVLDQQRATLYLRQCLQMINDCSLVSALCRMVKHTSETKKIKNKQRRHSVAKKSRMQNTLFLVTKTSDAEEERVKFTP